MSKVFLISFLLLATVSFGQATQQAEPFAVLELFTSEGCSDCPAAEEWLNEITLDAMADKTYVYPLSFHVDYWNKLGWRDVFSDAAYSNRQRAYRKTFGNEVVYTPQMIVNGQVEFVGSERDRTTKEIEKALSQTPPIYFHIEPSEDWTMLRYEVVGMDDEVRSIASELMMVVAIVERGLETKVMRGENQNRILKHENIVRYLTQAPFNPSGESIQMEEPPAELNKNFSIIAFVQEVNTMNILGANLWNY